MSDAGALLDATEPQLPGIEDPGAVALRRDDVQGLTMAPFQSELGSDLTTASKCSTTGKGVVEVMQRSAPFLVRRGAPEARGVILQAFPLHQEDEFAALVAVVDEGVHDPRNHAVLRPLDRRGAAPPCPRVGAAAVVASSQLVVCRAHQAQGLGSEMLQAILHLAFAGLSAEEALSSAFEDNADSLATSRAVGTRRMGGERTPPRRLGAHDRFRLGRDAWERRRRPDIEGPRARGVPRHVGRAALACSVSGRPATAGHPPWCSREPTA